MIKMIHFEGGQKKVKMNKMIKMIHFEGGQKKSQNEQNDQNDSFWSHDHFAK